MAEMLGEFCIIIKRLVVAERDKERLLAQPQFSARLTADRCEWCGTEKPTVGDRILCREAPCRMMKTEVRGDSP